METTNPVHQTRIQGLSDLQNEEVRQWLSLDEMIDLKDTPQIAWDMTQRRKAKHEEQHAENLSKQMEIPHTLVCTPEQHAIRLENKETQKRLINLLDFLHNQGYEEHAKWKQWHDLSDEQKEEIEKKFDQAQFDKTSPYFVLTNKDLELLDSYIMSYILDI